MKPDRTAHFTLSFRVAGQTDIGCQREQNQDAILLYPELGFFVLSDGMGGLDKGTVAAQYACESMTEMARICLSEYDLHKDESSYAKSMQTSAQLMSDHLSRSGNPDKRVLYGATLVCLTLVKNKAVIVSLGDSRAYLLSRYHKNPRQITEDHTIAELLVQNGDLTREQARNHPSAAQLTAFAGMDPPATPDVFVKDVQAGDRILLCSDGLYGQLSDRDIAHTLRSSKNPDRVCQRLVERANASGGNDNISVIYLKIMPD
ncbi:MAG: protein phosphatase 2C domain-containing protein [Christensenella sp.]|nr:protein phosphatase 2C domain-containing protein [Christensenella sp.]